AGAQILQDLPPQIAFAQQLVVRLELVKGHLPFVHAIAVAVVTILDKDRLHLLPKVRPGRVLRAETEGTKRGGHEQRGPPGPKLVVSQVGGGGAAAPPCAAAAAHPPDPNQDITCKL